MAVAGCVSRSVPEADVQWTEVMCGIEAVDRFRAVADAAQAELNGFEISRVVAIEEALAGWNRPALMKEFGPAVDAKFREVATACGSAQQNAISRLLIARLGQALPVRFRNLPLTERVRYHCARAVERLLTFLESNPENYCYPNELFVKDLRFVLGRAIPAGAAILELHSRMGGSVLASYMRRRPVAALRAGGNPACFRLYLDPRYLDEFNADGFVRYYEDAADMIALYPEAAVFTCRSWFMDPQLRGISPHLTNLFEVPRAANAYFLMHKATVTDRERALRTSATRRRLHQEGTYKPRSASVVWPREAMLAWRNSK